MFFNRCNCCGGGVTPNTTVAGTIFGCNTLGIAATVQIKNGSTVLATVTASSSGVYTASFFLSGTITATVSATNGTGRFQAGTHNYSVTGGGTTGSANVTLSPVAPTPGYICAFGCAYPWSDNLMINGTFPPSQGGSTFTATLVWQPAFSNWKGSAVGLVAFDTLIVDTSLSLHSSCGGTFTTFNGPGTSCAVTGTGQITWIWPTTTGCYNAGTKFVATELPP